MIGITPFSTDITPLYRKLIAIFIKVYGIAYIYFKQSCIEVRFGRSFTQAQSCYSKSGHKK
jgi:hypothetical protein